MKRHPRDPRRALPITLLILLAIGVSAWTAALAAPLPAQERPVVRTDDDLPRHDYAIEGSVLDMIQSPSAFAPLGKQMRADLTADLAEYDIQDQRTLRQMHQTLLFLDLLAEDYDAALAHVVVLRELEEKPALKLITGIQAEAQAAAAERVGGRENLAAFRKAFREEYERRARALPWEPVQEVAQSYKGQMETLNENLILGIAKLQLEPVLEEEGMASGDIAWQIARYHGTMQLIIPLKDEIRDVLAQLIEENRVEKPGIWEERDLDLSGNGKLAPVLIAVWDTGVDAGLFSDRIYTNPLEILDGIDNDGNGFVDDVHGIAYGIDSRPSSGNLYPMDQITRPLGELQDFSKGIYDIRAALDTPEATNLKQFVAALEPDDVQSFYEDLGHYAAYAHGTHVAGIALKGNPAASILNVRFTADVSFIPEEPTLARAQRDARHIRDIVAYLRERDVRVVNMSWVETRSAYERSLELNNVGWDAEERRRLAGEMFDIIKQGMLNAFRSAPEILFVGAAGNMNNDVTFDEFVPPMLELPNLIIAGAVDHAGDATTFTSYGPTVQVYANGYEVESVVPGGDRIKYSGTSMAAPHVANLGAKLIALDPELSPAAVIELIVAGSSERREGNRVLKVIDPKRSAELLEKRQAKG